MANVQPKIGQELQDVEELKELLELLELFPLAVSAVEILSNVKPQHPMLDSWFRQVVYRYHLLIEESQEPEIEELVAKAVALEKESPKEMRAVCKVKHLGKRFTEEKFANVVNSVKKVMIEQEGKLSRLGHGNVDLCVLLTLYWLRKGDTFEILAHMANLASVGVAHAIITRYLMYLRAAIDLVPTELWPSYEFKFNEQFQIKNAFGTTKVCVGTVDCTTCTRQRVRPGASKLYRGDHSTHALTVQLVTDLKGRILDVVVADGRNCDLTTLRLSRVIDRLKLTNRAILGDGGYEQDDVIITTESALYKKGIVTAFNQAHSGVRQTVEVTNSRLKRWLGPTLKCRLGIQWQAMAIVVAANLTNLTSNFENLEHVASRSIIQNREVLLDGPKIVRGRLSDGTLVSTATLIYRDGEGEGDSLIVGLDDPSPQEPKVCNAISSIYGVLFISIRPH